MELKELMESFAARVGLEGLEPDPFGVYVLSFDEMAVAFKEDEPGQLILIAPFAKKPEEGTDHLAELLLSANHLQKATGGATISLDADSGDYCLQRRDRLSALDGEGFSLLIETFVNKLEEFRNLVQEFRPAFDQAEADADREREAISGYEASGFLQV